MTMTKLRTAIVSILILAGASLLTFFLVYTVQLQHHIIPEEEREADSYIQRMANRKRVKAVRDHFHKIVTEEPSAVERESVCFLCHTTLPHHKNKKNRALLNMHTFYLSCESCHNKAAGVEGMAGAEGVSYGWLDPAGADPSRGHYGTRYNPLSGSLIRVNLESRIAPFVTEEGQRRFLVQKKNSPMARDYIHNKDNLNEQEKDFVKKKFHEGVRPVGHACKACHKPEGILDFEGLGFEVKRRSDLETLSVSGMLTRYETFFLPELFE